MSVNEVSTSAGPTADSGVPFGRSIVLKQTAFVALLVSFTGGILILAGYGFVRSLLRDQIDARLVVAASERQSRLQAYIRQQHERVALVASRTRLRQLVEEHVSGKLEEQPFRTQAKTILIDAQQSTEGFQSIAIANLQGKVIAATDDDVIGKDYSMDSDVVRGRQDKHLGTPRRAAGYAVALLTAPVVARSGQSLAVVIVVLDIAEMAQMLAEKTGLGDSGEIIVGTALGPDQIEYLLPPQSAPETTRVLSVQVPAMTLAVNRQSGFMHTRDYRGKEVVAVYRPVHYLDWGMVAKIDTAEAYAPLARLRNLMLGLETVMLVIGLVSSYLLARRFTRPILELAENATAVASGNWNVRATVKSPDELGQLAEAFNRMTVQLAGSYATLEQRVADRTEALARSNEDLQRFASVASHDLQEPLRAVGSFCQLLGETYGTKFDDEGKLWLGFVVDGAKRMQEMVQALLEFSRIESGGKALEPTRVEDALARALTNLQGAIESSGAQVTHDELPVLPADGVQLAQVFQNLIGNAIKFRGDKPPHVHVAASRDGDGWTFSVRDNGIGIEPRHFSRLFAIFQRLHGRDQYPGTGIGLALCKRIVERHGGRVWLESEPGNGTTFFFTLRSIPRSVT